MEFHNPRFRLFIGQVILLITLILGTVISVNYFVDASQVITTRSSKDMARLALNGQIVAVPKNYNERAYQVSIIEQMKAMPETIVIGSSRGMYLGKDITGYDSIYNHCVSGACMEDYYALLGLYDKKFSKLPGRIIIEVSPWVFYENNPDSRWSENITYRSACKNFYETVSGKKFIHTNLKKENPYLSIPYFQYNLETIKEKGSKAFTTQPAKASDNISEQADYPDGTIRYAASLEQTNPKRLEKVRSTNRGVTYQNVHKMKKIGSKQKQDFERLVNYLLEKNIEITFYLQPFSLTQCKFIYEKNTNPVFGKIEKYLTDFSTQCNVTNIGKLNSIKVIGSYNAKYYNLSDESFIDFMHLDKAGTAYVWKSFRKKWLSIGDSIAYGMTSNLKGTRNKRGTSWTRYLADAAGYNLISQEVRGMGYIRVGPNQISFEQTLRKVESMTEDCKLVTVALGIDCVI